MELDESGLSLNTLYSQVFRQAFFNMNNRWTRKQFLALQPSPFSNGDQIVLPETNGRFGMYYIKDYKSAYPPQPRILCRRPPQSIVFRAAFIDCDVYNLFLVFRSLGLYCSAGYCLSWSRVHCLHTDKHVRSAERLNFDIFGEEG